MQIKIIKDLKGIKNLKQQWDELFNIVQPSVFIHHTWVYENYRCFNYQKILLLAIFDNDKKLIGVFPFAIAPFRIKFLTFKTLTHGCSAITDYSQFLVDPQANSRLMIKRVLAKLLEIQNDTWDMFKIDRLNDNDNTSNLFKNMALKTFYAGVTSTEATPLIRLDHGHQEAKKVSDIKRKFKKIAQNCTITHSIGAEINHSLLENLSHLHQKSFPDSGFDQKQSQAFYQSLIDDPDFSQYVYLSRIEHEKKLIAAHFGFVDSKAFYYYVPTYDENYSTYGPGQYLLWQLIQLANKKNLQTFDFLRGSEQYKFDWTNKISTNYTIFGVPEDAGLLKKALVNLWLITKEIPFFKRPSEK